MTRPTSRRPRLSRTGPAVALGLLCTLVGPARASGVAAGSDPVGVWPLTPAPEVVAGFDPPSSRWGAGHRGVDLLGSVGRRVRTALPGTVSFTGRIAGRGVVVVSHGDTRTTYEPVTGTREVGTAVAAGSPIGRLELPGSHCSPRACLHWGWRRGETYLDPLALVGAGPVRLLPLWRDEPVDAGSLVVRTTAPLRGAGAAFLVRWSPPVPPYAAWRPPVGDPPGAQARGCACW